MYGLPEAQNTREIFHNNAVNPDILNRLENPMFPEAYKQVEENNFYKKFEGDTLLQTCKNVFAWLPAHVKYLEDGQRQKIKLPARLLSNGSGDCKSFALFCCAVLAHYAPVSFRYVSYDSDKTPTHVYCVVKEPGQKNIIIDPCWNKFNSERGYTYKYDHAMTVEGLRGVGATMTPSQSAIRQHILTEIIMLRKLKHNGAAYRALKREVNSHLRENGVKLKISGIKIGDAGDDSDDTDLSDIDTSADLGNETAPATTASSTNTFAQDLASAAQVATTLETGYELATGKKAAPLPVLKTKSTVNANISISPWMYAAAGVLALIVLKN